MGELDHDLTRNAAKNGEPLGERIVVTGRVLDEDGRAVPDTLIEIWQANAAGRYIHQADQHDAPLDPNFLGAGRCVTDEEGRYRFYSIKPGAYPWKNHPQRLAAQPHPLLAVRAELRDPSGHADVFPGRPAPGPGPDLPGGAEGARERLIARFSIDVTEPEFALGYVFDIVLRGRNETPMET